MESGSGDRGCITDCNGDKSPEKLPLWSVYVIGLIVIFIILMAVITLLSIVRSYRICKKVRVSRKTKQQFSVTYVNIDDPVFREMLQEASNTNSSERNNSNDQSDVMQSAFLNTEIQDCDSANTTTSEEATSSDLEPTLIPTMEREQKETITTVQSNTNEIHIDESALSPLATEVIKESIYDHLAISQKETKDQVTLIVYSEEKKDESIQNTSTVSPLGSASQECYDDSINEQDSYEYDDIDTFVASGSRDHLSDDIDGPARRLPGLKNAGRDSAYYIYIPEMGVEGIYTAPDNVERERNSDYLPIISERDPSVRPTDEGIYTLPDDPNQRQSLIYNTIDEIEQFPSDKNYSYAELHVLSTSEEPIGEIRAEGNDESNLDYSYTTHRKLHSSSSEIVRGIVKAKKDNVHRLNSANPVCASIGQQKINDCDYENLNEKDKPQKWNSDVFPTVRAEVSDPVIQSSSGNNKSRSLTHNRIYENTSGTNDDDYYFINSKDWMRTNSLPPEGSFQTATGRPPPPLTDETPPSSNTYMPIFKRDMYKHDYVLPTLFSLESSTSQPTDTMDKLGIRVLPRRRSYDDQKTKTHKYENQSMWLEGISKTMPPSSVDTYTKIEKHLCEDEGVYMFTDTSPVVSPVKTTADK